MFEPARLCPIPSRCSGKNAFARIRPLSSRRNAALKLSWARKSPVNIVFEGCHALALPSRIAAAQPIQQCSGDLHRIAARISLLAAEKFINIRNQTGCGDGR